MAPYDSDSSDSDDEYTETGVLLGYASKESTSDTISQLGGHPTWLDDKTPAPGGFAKCKVCNGLLTLLLELNGDLPERFAGHERRLYVLGCRRKACKKREGSIRGFRATRASKLPTSSSSAKATPSTSVSQPEPAQKQQPMDLGASLFGAKPSANPAASANPFSSAGSPSQPQANPFASASSLAAKAPQPSPSSNSTPSITLSESFASKARISSPEPTTPSHPLGPQEPWPSTSSFPAPYPQYNLDADYETLDKQPNEIPANARVDMDIDGEPNGASSSSGGAGDDKPEKEIFESAMDRTFQKFADRLAQNPEQVLRYEFAGQPLLYARDDAVGRLLGGGTHGEGKVLASGSRVPRCGNCGAERVFELQLTPQAIAELEAEELGLEGMEWGTIILMVCGKDCVQRGVSEGQAGYVEEWVGVQWEEIVRHGPPR